MSRIGILTTSFPRRDGDVAGLFVLGFARALGALGHEVTVLAPEPREDAYPPSAPGVTVRHVPYVRPRFLARTFYGAGAPDNLRRDLLAWPGALAFPAALLRAARAEGRGWDAIVSHWALPCGLVGSAIARGRPHLAVLHSADVHLLGRLPGRALLAGRIASGATALLCAAPAVRDRFLGCLPAASRATVAARTEVLAMGVDAAPATTDREAARQRLGLTRFTLLALGRLVPIKGVDDAVRAVAGDPSLELVVAGDGPERRRLERLARDLGANARFTGTVTGAAKHELLAAADLLLVPSRPTSSGRTEGMPVAALEAMAAGLPIVASATGGLATLPGGTALLVPPRRPDALRAAIARLRGDAALRARLAELGRVHASGQTWDALAPRLSSLIQGSTMRVPLGNV